MPKNIFAAAGIALLLTAGAAEATPITTPPPTLTALGDVTAIYVFADAGDASILNEVTPFAISEIFCNHDISGTCTASVAGATMDLGVQSGPMVFSLVDTSTGGTTYFSNAVAADTFYHVLISSDYSAYNQGSLSGAAQTVIQNMQAQGRSVTYVGFEDQINGDYDYNDLIFAFAGTVARPVPLPEPITISLFGIGVAGAGFMTYRRRRRSA